MNYSEHSFDTMPHQNMRALQTSGKQSTGERRNLKFQMRIILTGPEGEIPNSAITTRHCLLVSEMNEHWNTGTYSRGLRA